MNRNLIKVYLTFTNKKGIEKTVHFLMDKQLYKDLMTLSEKEKNYWLEYYYHEYCNEQNQNRKEFRNRELYLKVDDNLSDEENEKISSVNKIAQIADPEDVEKSVFNKRIVDEILSLLDDAEKYIVINVLMYDVPKTQVARDLGISITAVSKKLDKIKDKVTMLYDYN